MFRRLQLKMTIYYTIILIAIMMVTNVTIYFLLSTYNNYQLSSEIETMLNNIEGSEWIQEPGDVQDTINQDDGTKPPEIDDNTGTDDEESDNSNNEIETDSIDDVNDSETHSDDSIDDSSDNDKDDSSDDDEDDSSDDDKDDRSSIDNLPTSQGIDDLLATNSDGSIAHISTLSYKTVTEPNDGHEAYEIKMADIEELIIPKTLSNFSFYFIYDNADNLVTWENINTGLYDQILVENSKLVMGNKPEVVQFANDIDTYYLMMKMPIIIDTVQYGYYCAGRDVTIAYETINNLLNIMKYSLIIGVLISLLAGFLIAGRAIKPIQDAYLVKQNFVANASHELRTPISVIMLSTETLKREMDSNNEFLQQTVDDINGEAINMKGLVENLLFLARNDASSLNIEKEHLDLSELIQKNILSYQKISKEKDIVIKSCVENDLKMVGDVKLLSSMISVLIDNAIKYTPKNGTVTISGKLNKSKKHSEVILTVEDTGIGIKKEEVPYIFDRFYRVENSRSKETGGYGLGLSIVKEIIDYHQGFVEVTSVVNQGSSFKVVLPVG